MTLSLAVAFVVASVWGAAAWVARTERRAEAGRRFHRHVLRRHRRDLAVDLATLDAEPVAPTVAPRLVVGVCPAGRALAPSPPRPVCRTRRPADGSPDSVRERVFREVVRHPYRLGHLVAESDGRVPWRRSMIGCPRHGGQRPALFVTV
mgnify:FL=1